MRARTVSFTFVADDDASLERRIDRCLGMAGFEDAVAATSETRDATIQELALLGIVPEDACPGCGCMPGDGLTPGCQAPLGCGRDGEWGVTHDGEHLCSDCQLLPESVGATRRWNSSLNTGEPIAIEERQWAVIERTRAEDEEFPLQCAHCGKDSLKPADGTVACPGCGQEIIDAQCGGDGICVSACFAHDAARLGRTEAIEIFEASQCEGNPPAEDECREIMAAFGRATTSELTTTISIRLIVDVPVEVTTAQLTHLLELEDDPEQDWYDDELAKLLPSEIREMDIDIESWRRG